MILEQPSFWLRWMFPRALWRMDKNDHSVYLTFDDGPIPEVTPFILKTLRDFDAKATFFMVGDNVRKYPIGAHLFRPPHGVMTPGEYYWLLRKYKIVMWDLVTRDYSRRMTANDVVENVRTYTRNGSIITFHDSLKSIDKLHTALPASLRWLCEQGYAFKVFE